MFFYFWHEGFLNIWHYLPCTKMNKAEPIDGLRLLFVSTGHIAAMPVFMLLLPGPACTLPGAIPAAS